MILQDILKNKYIDSGEIESLLKNSNIQVLRGFLDNWNAIRKFNNQFYGNKHPKTVLCGINPGKLGAGKTGIPFVDFTSLSKMIEGVDRDDTERSAQFFYDIVQELGVCEFYRSFYVTNVSWVGYVRNEKNVNYYDLPVAAKAFVYEMFKLEMDFVFPVTIVSLAASVKETVEHIFGQSEIDTTKKLPHPNYCAFPKNYEECKTQYIELLSPYIHA